MTQRITIIKRRAPKLTKREKLVAAYAKLPTTLRFVITVVPTAAVASFPLVYASGLLTKGILWPSIFFGFVICTAALRNLFFTTRKTLLSNYTNRISAALDGLIAAFARHRHVSSDAVKDLLHAMNLVVRTLTGISESDSILVGIMRPSADGSELLLSEKTGTLGSKHKERVPIASGRASAVAFRKNKVVVIPDTKHEDTSQEDEVKPYDEEEEIRSVVAIPLTVPNRPQPLAVLVIGADMPGIFKTTSLPRLDVELRPYEKLVTLCLLTGESG
jgi:hypothetical protein